MPDLLISDLFGLLNVLKSFSQVAIIKGATEFNFNN